MIFTTGLQARAAAKHRNIDLWKSHGPEARDIGSASILIHIQARAAAKHRFAEGPWFRGA